MRLLGECRDSIDTVKRMGFELKEDEDTVSGLADPSSSESQMSGNATLQPIMLTCSIYLTCCMEAKRGKAYILLDIHPLGSKW